MPRIMQKAKSVAGVKDAGLAPKRPAATVQKAVLGGDGSQPKGLTAVVAAVEKKKKAVVAAGGKKKKGKGKKEKGAYETYIYRVLKQVHPGMTISMMAMSTMNSFMKDMFERLTAEASHLIKTTNKPTLTAREITTATRLLLPGELAKHAVTEGSKAVHNFKRSFERKREF